MLCCVYSEVILCVLSLAVSRERFWIFLDVSGKAVELTAEE
jgi:hypothetical protein